MDQQYPNNNQYDLNSANGQQPANPGTGLSVAGIILGVVSCLLFWIPFFNTVGLVTAIVGLILAILGRKKAIAAGAPTGLGTAGLVISIIGTVLAAIGFITCTLCVICALGTLDPSDWDEIMNAAYQYQ